jgi:hypothetical protein
MTPVGKAPVSAMHRFRPLEGTRRRVFLGQLGDRTDAHHPQRVMVHNMHAEMEVSHRIGSLQPISR